MENYRRHPGRRQATATSRDESGAPPVSRETADGAASNEPQHQRTERTEEPRTVSSGNDRSSDSSNRSGNDSSSSNKSSGNGDEDNKSATTGASDLSGDGKRQRQSAVTTRSTSPQHTTRSTDREPESDQNVVAANDEKANSGNPVREESNPTSFESTQQLLLQTLTSNQAVIAKLRLGATPQQQQQLAMAAIAMAAAGAMSNLGPVQGSDNSVADSLARQQQQQQQRQLRSDAIINAAAAAAAAAGDSANRYPGPDPRQDVQQGLGRTWQPGQPKHAAADSQPPNVQNNSFPDPRQNVASLQRPTRPVSQSSVDRTAETPQLSTQKIPPSRTTQQQQQNTKLAAAASLLVPSNQNREPISAQRRSLVPGATPSAISAAGSTPSASAALASSHTVPSTFGDSLSFLKQYKSARQVACRARGMPKHHNAKTAYFILHQDMMHAEPLLCSHRECQKRGIRFLYCKVCDLPVAERNFSTRHKHSDVLGNNLGRPGNLDKPTNPTAKSAHVATAGTNKRKRTAPSAPEDNAVASKPDTRSADAADDRIATTTTTTTDTSRSSDGAQESTSSNNSHAVAAESTSAQRGTVHKKHKSKHAPELKERTSTNERPPLTKPSSDYPDGKPSRGSRIQPGTTDKRDESRMKFGSTSSSFNSNDGDGSLDTNTEDEVSSIGSSDPKHRKRKVMWQSLLALRPSSMEGDEMSAWLMAVLAVSNPQDSPMDIAQGSSDTPTSSSGDYMADSSSENDESNTPVDPSDTNTDSNKPSSGNDSNANDSNGNDSNTVVQDSYASPISGSSKTSDSTLPPTMIKTTSEHHRRRRRHADNEADRNSGSSISKITSDSGGGQKQECHDTSDSFADGAAKVENVANVSLKRKKVSSTSQSSSSKSTSTEEKMENDIEGDTSSNKTKESDENTAAKASSLSSEDDMAAENAGNSSSSNS